MIFFKMPHASRHVLDTESVAQSESEPSKSPFYKDATHIVIQINGRDERIDISRTLWWNSKSR